MERLSTCAILNIIVGKLNRIFVFVELWINSNDIQFDISVVIVDKVIFGFVYKTMKIIYRECWERLSRTDTVMFLIHFLVYVFQFLVK